MCCDVLAGCKAFIHTDTYTHSHIHIHVYVQTHMTFTLSTYTHTPLHTHTPTHLYPHTHNRCKRCNGRLLCSFLCNSSYSENGTAVKNINVKEKNNENSVSFIVPFLFAEYRSFSSKSFLRHDCMCHAVCINCGNLVFCCANIHFCMMQHDYQYNAK